MKLLSLNVTLKRWETTLKNLRITYVSCQMMGCLDNLPSTHGILPYLHVASRYGSIGHRLITKFNNFLRNHGVTLHNREWYFSSLSCGIHSLGLRRPLMSLCSHRLIKPFDLLFHQTPFVSLYKNMFLPLFPFFT